jgi:hypothetical protein
MRRRTRALACAALPLALAFNVVPAQGLEENAGGGDAEGAVTFASPAQSVPPLGQPCAATSWTFSGSSTLAAVFDVNGSEYIGSLSIRVAGGSSCATVDHEIGTVTALTASGANLLLNSRLACGYLAGTGTYVRVASHVVLDVTATCQVNNWSPAHVQFVASGEFTPTQGDGVLTAVSAAQFDGAFSTIPG